MDIFKMANQLANSMSNDDKNTIENMDMEQMISHVTKNVFKMMNGMNQSPEEGEEIETGNESDTSSDSVILQKTRDICFDLNVDLEDFYTGKKKKLNVKRKRILLVNGKQTVVEEKKKLIIPIEKGMKDEQQIRFEGEADQIPGYKSGDIVITLIENEHPLFQRDSDNLIIIKNINLYQIYDVSFDIKHLDGRILRINKNPSDALHLNESLRKITNEGMPCYKGNGETGDMFIRFNIVIPKSLDTVKLSLLKDIFDEPLDTEALTLSADVIHILEHVTDTDIEDLDSDSDYSETESDSDSDSGLESESESEPEPVIVKKSLKKK